MRLYYIHAGLQTASMEAATRHRREKARGAQSATRTRGFFYEQKFGWGSLTLPSATTSWSADVKTSVHTPQNLKIKYT